MGIQITPSRRTPTSRTSTPRTPKASRRLLSVTSCNAMFAWAVLLTASLALYVASLKSDHLASLRHVIVKAVTGSVDDAFFAKTELLGTSLDDMDRGVERLGQLQVESDRTLPLGAKEVGIRMFTLDAQKLRDNADSRVGEEMATSRQSSETVSHSEGRGGSRKGSTGHGRIDGGHVSKDNSAGDHTGKSFPISVPAGERWKPPAGRRCANVEEMGEAATGNTAEASLKIRRAIKEHFAVHGATVVRSLPASEFCRRSFVASKTSHDGLGNTLYKLLTAPALAMVLNRSAVVGEIDGKQKLRTKLPAESAGLRPWPHLIDYSEELLTMREVRQLWQQHDCEGMYGRQLALRYMSFDKSSFVGLMCHDWMAWSTPVLWLDGATDSIAIQALLKSLHPAVRSSASSLLGRPWQPDSRGNLFGELAAALLRPSLVVQQAITWALGSRGEVDYAVHFRHGGTPAVSKTVAMCLLRQVSSVEGVPESDSHTAALRRMLMATDKQDGQLGAEDAATAAAAADAADATDEIEAGGAMSGAEANYGIDYEVSKAAEGRRGQQLREDESASMSAVAMRSSSDGRGGKAVRRPRVVVVSDHLTAAKKLRLFARDFAQVIHFNHTQFLQEFPNCSAILREAEPPKFRVRDWGPMPRWVAVVEFFLASRARHAFVSAGRSRIYTTFAQLSASLAAARNLGDDGNDHGFQLISSFWKDLLLPGLYLQTGRGYAWNTFAGKLSCKHQPAQCARTPAMPYAWWDGPWQSPLKNGLKRLAKFGVNFPPHGRINKQVVLDMCHGKAPPPEMRLPLNASLGFLRM